ncbi:MAG TPA: hypothetical protein PKE03_05405 [Bacteroidales bacterium]|nr:hypothetical protein [Bacteroidales bacterium]
MTSLKNIGHLGQAARYSRQLAEMAESIATSNLPLHKADADLLRSKALQLYEEILSLKAESTDGLPVAEPPAPTEKATEIPAAKASAPAFEEPAEPVFRTTEEETKEPDAHTHHPTISEPAFQSPTTQNLKQESLQHQKRPVSTMPDLFTESGFHLQDKLAAQPDNSVAARLGRSPISDLRKAIGINDKFLFINELFDGNIQQYNHAVDELDGFRSYNGAKTYLIELSVLYGWDTESQAAQKLHELIDRKFEQG